jgi:SAM-dependent methyltransferase
MTTTTLPATASSMTLDDAPTAGMFERVTCYLCGGDAARPFISSVDDLTGRPGRFTFVRCEECGLAYQSPRLTLNHVKSYYGDGYIAHRKTSWGVLGPFFEWVMGALDRAKRRIVERVTPLTPSSAVLDVGCGAGGFLAHVHERTGATVAGVDFVDLSTHPGLRGVEFHHGLFYEQAVGASRFDVVTMWHFLEHDYDPVRSLASARQALKPGGHLVVEVPRLDSLSFRMFGHRWPGLQAPQHTVLYDKATLITMMERAGFEVVEYLPYGAFPPYFYLFCGAAFTVLRGRGLNLQKGLWAYLAGQVLLLPVLPILKHLNFAMQTVICRRAQL